MKTYAVLLTLLLCTAVIAQTGNSSINFNLVQVNHYHGQEQATADIATPGPRIVVDPTDPNAIHMLRALEKPATPSAPWDVLIQMNAGLRATESAEVPWESSKVLVSPTGQDSFLVTSSKTGCPGTEVRPSVSVAFPSGRGWSFPPIRFGPLSESTVCALGNGQKLEVSVVGSRSPRIRLLCAR